MALLANGEFHEFERMIERRVSKRIDLLDNLLLSGRLSQLDYDASIAEIDLWAARQYQAYKPHS